MKTKSKMALAPNLTLMLRSLKLATAAVLVAMLGAAVGTPAAADPPPQGTSLDVAVGDTWAASWFTYNYLDPCLQDVWYPFEITFRVEWNINVEENGVRVQSVGITAWNQFEDEVMIDPMLVGLGHTYELIDPDDGLQLIPRSHLDPLSQEWVPGSITFPTFDIPTNEQFFPWFNATPNIYLSMIVGLPCGASDWAQITFALKKTASGGGGGGCVCAPPPPPGGGGLAAAEPALIYDQGSSMKTYRWMSTGTSFSRLVDYQSGAFQLSKVGERVASGDVDGDGDDDIVMAYQNGDYTFDFWVFKQGTQSGIWYHSGQFTLDPFVGGRLVVGDFNGDGKDEPALVHDDGDGTFSTYRWLSTGSSFARTTDYHSGSFNLANVQERVAVGDADGDGKDDIVMAYQNGTVFDFWVFKQGYTGAAKWYTSGPFGLDRVGNRLVVGDFNGNGKAEPALVYDDGDGTFTTYRWLSSGSSFTRTTDYHSGSFSIANVGERVAVGDTDGDGKDDIVMAYQNGAVFDFWVFKQGYTGAAKWYTSGPFGLGPVGNRLLVGDWA